MPDDVVAWLRETIGATESSSADLESTYAFVHVLNARRELMRLVPPTVKGQLLWWIQFFDPDSTPVVEPPLARAVLRAQLRSDPTKSDVVARNLAFFIRPEFRRRGFGRAVYEAERTLYSRWCVREIHIDAHDQGPAVWIKRFGFQPEDPDELLADYEQWARRARAPTRFPPSTVAALPDEFLNGKPHLRLYKVLA